MRTVFASQTNGSLSAMLRINLLLCGSPQSTRLFAATVGEKVPGGRLRGIRTGSWSQCMASKSWGALHEPQRAAGILPAEDSEQPCRRDVGSTLGGGAVRPVRDSSLGFLSSFVICHSDFRQVLTPTAALLRSDEALQRCSRRAPLCPFRRRLELPLLAEKSGVHNSARCARRNRQGNIDDRPVRQLRHLTSVVQVIVFPKGETAVEHDVALWVQWIRVNQHRDVSVPRIIRLRRVYALRVPADWQLVCNSRQQLVARRIAPQHEVVRRDVVGGDFRVVFHSHLAAELPAPVVYRMIHFCRRPLPEFFADRLAGGWHHEERIHERVVNWALQTVAFLQCPSPGQLRHHPFLALFTEMRRPRTVR